VPWKITAPFESKEFVMTSHQLITFLLSASLFPVVYSNPMQGGPHSMPGQGMGMGAQATCPASAKAGLCSSAFGRETMPSMHQMHQDMMRAEAFNGNADHDFLVMMIPHHKGAIDMAESVLQHGKDPQLRKLAQNIIAAQKKEISEMESHLAQMNTTSSVPSKAK
jgi:hypothetical protein